MYIGTRTAMINAVKDRKTSPHGHQNPNMSENISIYISKLPVISILSYPNLITWMMFHPMEDIFSLQKNKSAFSEMFIPYG